MKQFGNLIYYLLLVGLACGGQQALPPTATTQPPQPPTAPPTPETATDNGVRALTIFYTNDEHGWMEGVEPGRGAAEMVGLWQELGYQPDGPYLILSGGDLWTGPAISTWFEGQSMTEVMNSMGYGAAAVGNHDFDFGLEGLRARAFEANFPLLSANTREKVSGRVPTDLGIEPYVVQEINGIQVGIIGLTTTSTPWTTNPTNVADLDFIDYETALREAVPQAKADGAELLVVAGHLCQEELRQLAGRITDLGIAMIGGGHCNELFVQEVDGMVLLEGGYHLTSFATVTFQFDTGRDTVLAADYAIYPNEGGPTDPTVDAIVAHWQALTDEELNVVIGYTDAGIGRRTVEMETLITESWLWSYPTADVAITNLGGIRAGLPAGEITFGDVVGVMPFNNVLVELHLTGQQLLRVLAFSDAAVGGAHLGVGEWLLNESGQAIDPAGTYTLLVNDFMYAGGDGYTMLAEYDPQAYNTAIDWRQPLIDWLLAQNSNSTRPVDSALQQLGQN